MEGEKKVFAGRKIPGEIKALTKLSPSSFGEKILESVVSDVLASIFGEVPETIQTSSDYKNCLDDDELLVLVSGIHRLFILIFKCNMNSEEVLEEDMKELKIHPNIISAVSNIFKKKPNIFAMASQLGPRLNSLESFQWRVDVGISNSLLSKELQAVVTMKMLTTDGSIHVFEVPAKKFHEFRFNVATVLKEMELLENSRFLNITDSK